MDQADFLVRDDPRIGPGAKRILLECAHGRTSAVVLPGRKPLADLVVLDLLKIRHDRRQGCDCTAVIRPKPSDARALATPSTADPAQIMTNSR